MGKIRPGILGEGIQAGTISRLLRGEACQAGAIGIDLPQPVLTAINRGILVALILNEEEEHLTGIANYTQGHNGLGGTAVDGRRWTASRRLLGDTTGALPYTYSTGAECLKLKAVIDKEFPGIVAAVKVPAVGRLCLRCELEGIRLLVRTLRRIEDIQLRHWSRYGSWIGRYRLCKHIDPFAIDPGTREVKLRWVGNAHLRQQRSVRNVQQVQGLNCCWLFTRRENDLLLVGRPLHTADLCCRPRTAIQRL